MRATSLYRTFLAAICIFTLLLSSMACAADTDKAETETRVGEDYIAVVNGTQIDKSEFDRKLNLIKSRYASMGMALEGEQLTKLEENILNNLIEKEMLRQEAQKKGIEVDPQEVEDQVQQLKGQFENEAEFNKKIASMDYNEDILRQQIRENLAIRTLIDQEVASKVSISDEEVEAFYENNKDQYKEPEQVHARHILIRSKPEGSDAQKADAKKKIEAVQEKLDKGGDFAELAKDYSEGPSNKNGGDLGFFTRGQMVEKFDDAVFALEPGEISDIVETRFGYHLIKLEEKKPANQKAFSEVEENIRQQLKQQQVMQNLEPYIESLKEQYPIEKNLPADDGQG